jgi:uncharacterized protein YwqG
MNLPPQLSKYVEAIRATIKPCVVVTASEEPKDPLASRVGGIPPLPVGVDVPTNRKGNPLSFLAQINWSEVPPLNGFPKTGLLQFYISRENLFGWNPDRPTDQDGFRLLYFEEPPRPPYHAESVLSKADQPFPHEGPAKGLSFEKAKMPVTGGDFRVNALNFESDDDFDTYMDLPTVGNRIGGYPDFTQTDPREYNRQLREYELLFQLDSDPDLGLMWGDAGIGNFFVQPADLAKCDFSNVLYNWDCG